jgi:hypothetical protein
MMATLPMVLVAVSLLLGIGLVRHARLAPRAPRRFEPIRYTQPTVYIMVKPEPRQPRHWTSPERPPALRSRPPRRVARGSQPLSFRYPQAVPILPSVCEALDALDRSVVTEVDDVPPVFG